MNVDTLRAITAICLVIVTLACCTFVYLKTRNDSSIAEDTKRIADAAELAYFMRRDSRPKQDHSLPLSMRF